MKLYYAKSDAVAAVTVTGGKLTKVESDRINYPFVSLGMKPVSERKYRDIQGTLPEAKRFVNLTVDGDGKIHSEITSSRL